MGRRGKPLDLNLCLSIRNDYKVNKLSRSALFCKYKSEASYKTILKYAKMDKNRIISINYEKHHREGTSLVQGLQLQVFNELARLYCLPATPMHYLIDKKCLNLSGWMQCPSVSTCRNLIDRVFEADGKGCVYDSNEMPAETKNVRAHLKKRPLGTIAIHKLQVTWQNDINKTTEVTKLLIVADRGRLKMNHPAARSSWVSIASGGELNPQRLKLELFGNERQLNGTIYYYDSDEQIKYLVKAIKNDFKTIHKIMLVTNSEGIPTSLEFVDVLKKIFSAEIIEYDKPSVDSVINFGNICFNGIDDLFTSLHMFLSEQSELNNTGKKGSKKRFTAQNR